MMNALRGECNFYAVTASIVGRDTFFSFYKMINFKNCELYGQQMSGHGTTSLLATESFSDSRGFIKAKITSKYYKKYQQNACVVETNSDKG